MTDIFKQRILKFIRHREYKPLKFSALLKALDIQDEYKDEFLAAYTQLQQEGMLLVGDKKLVSVPEPKGIITGKFNGNPKGFGFVVPIERGAYTDLFISPSDTNGAMSGDIVSVKVVKKGVRGGKMAYAGAVLEILERGHSRFVATLMYKGGQWIARPDGTTIVEPVVVDDVSAKDAGENDKVVVEIIQYPQIDKMGRGVILEVLGKAGRYDTEIRSVIAQYNIEEKFPETCFDDARLAAENFNPDQLIRRADITDKIIITIDPETAKDFDDAISLEKTRDGHWRLGVHIADVSTFIPLESELDIEARKRGNSVYLPGKTIPMLPEILSNGICSLQPKQKRFTKTAYITYDNNGNIVDRNYENSLIQSTARLTYEQANDILNGKTDGFSSEVVRLLKDMDTLAKIIEQRRVKHGMLHLDLPETELEFDKDGQVIDAHPADTSYPHTIIEMFMVEANEAVASLFDRFNIPFIRRIHPDPDSLTTERLSRFIRVCGLKIPKKIDRKVMQDLLTAVKGTPKEFPVNLHILRSLTKAEYSPLHIGHFALASQTYCHFTSPIRRYADLMVHRLFQVYVEQRINQVGLEEVIPEAELTEIGKHITFTEQRSAAAEDDLKKVLILELLSKKIGSELEGAVTGFSSSSVFVHCYKYGIDAMFNMSDLGTDEWQYEERHGVVVGQHSGKRLEIGTPMKVLIVSVNLPTRQLMVAPSVPLVANRDELDYRKMKKSKLQKLTRPAKDKRAGKDKGKRRQR